MRTLDSLKPVIAITLGDMNGVGPEVTLKCVASSALQRKCRPILIGSRDVYEYYARLLKLNIRLEEISESSLREQKKGIPFIQILPGVRPVIQPGKISYQSGMFAGPAIAHGVQLCLEEKIDGMVTAPVSKKAMEMGGFRYPGQTEMLAELCGDPKVTMMLIAQSFRVGLATVHIPLKTVSTTLSRSLIAEKLSIIHRSLKNDFGIRKPKIAILGLNPHAGEQNLIGTEETAILIPAVRKAKKSGMSVDGPFPADGFFGTHAYNLYDAVLAMYHDQGLIPLKMKGFATGVNFTAGLPIIRTSPDHGTAFDIAGKGVADPSSMNEAIQLAVSIARRRGTTKN